MAEVRAIAELGVKNILTEIFATRGERLVLSRARFVGRDQRPEAFHTELIRIVEIDADERIVAVVDFDPDDIEAAIAELDARYLAGEAAAHCAQWSVIAQGYAAANRGELAATAPDVVNIDHRQLGMVESGGLVPYLRDAFDELANLRTYPEAVHRLADRGAVLTHVGAGTSKEGFDAEWRMINLILLDGDLISRSEMFDEADLDAALARFEQLTHPAPRLENAASQVWDRLNAYFSSGDWAAMSQATAENMIDDDRRRTVNGGIRRGRDIQIANGRAVAETGADKMTSTVIATRGGRLALCRTLFVVRNQEPGNFRIEFLSVVEIDVDEKLVAHVGFDLDDSTPPLRNSKSDIVPAKPPPTRTRGR